MPRTITIDGGLFLDLSPWNKGREVFTFVPDNFTSFGDCMFVKQHSFTVEVPDDFDPRQTQIAALEKQMADRRAEFQKYLTETQRRISELQAITHEVPA